MANPFSRTFGAKTTSTRTANSQISAQSLESLEKRYVFDVAVADTIEHIVNSHGLTPTDASHPAHQGEGLVAAARSISSSPDAANGHAVATSWLDAQLKTLESQFSIKPNIAGTTQVAADISGHPNATLAGEAINLARPSVDPIHSNVLLDAMNHAAPVDALHDAMPTQVAFIDGSLPDYQTIVKDLPAGVTAVIIDPTRDGIAQISSYLDSHPGVGAIHLVAHGVEGNLEIGTSVLDSNSIATVYKTALQSIGSHMVAGGDILIYGCNFAAGTDGANVENLIAQTTGMNVAAADHIVGAASMGGSWVLDKTIGQIDVASIQALDWNHDLLTISATDGATTAIGTLPHSASLGGQGATDTGAAVTYFIADANGNKVATGTTFNTAHGSVKIADPATGAYTYTANAGYTGTDTFKFYVEATDAVSGTLQNAVAIESVTIVPAALATWNDNQSIYGGKVATGNLAGDLYSNPTGASVTYALTAAAAHGTVVINPDGTFTYTPNAGYIGSDSFTWTVTDPTGIESSSTSTYTVNTYSPLYTTNNIWSAVTSGSSTVLSLAGNYYDQTSGSTFTYAFDPTTPLSNGTAVINGDGTITYTNTNTSGNTSTTGNGDVFNVIVTDNHGYSCKVQYNLTATTTGHLAPATVNEYYSVVQGNTIYHYQTGGYEALSTGSTVPLTYNYLTTPSKGVLTPNAADGTFNYVPEPGPAGLGTYTFDYTVTDSFGQTTAPATDTIVVSAPSLSTTGLVKYAAIGAKVSLNLDAQSAHSTTDPWVVGGVDGNGAAVAKHLAYTITKAPLHGTLAVDPANPTGGYIYTPNPGFSGVDSFTYDVFDGYNHVSSTDTIVSPANIFASNNLHTTPLNTPYSGTVSNVSGSPGGGLSWTNTFAPSHGSVTLNSDGTYTYTPTNGFHGVDRFGYRLTDATGHIASAYVDILIPSALVPGDVPPTSTAIPDQSNHDSNVVAGLDVAGRFTNNNASGSLTFFASGLPNGLTIDPTTGVISGTINHTDSQDVVNGQYAVTIIADDGMGGTTQQTFTWTVVNDPPVAQNHSHTTTAGVAVNGNASTGSSDPNAGDVLTFAQLTNPSSGSVTMNSDGTYTYTPNAGFSGTDTFSYQVSDGKGGVATATETITVAAPIAAVNDSYTTAFNTTLTNGNAAAGDTYAAGSTFAATSAPSHGTVAMNADGTYIYVPATGYSGTDTFTYKVTDSFGQVATATETITIGAPPAIAAVNDSYSTPFNTALTTGNAATGDTFATGSTFAKTTNPAHGTVVMNANGTYTYTPTSGYTGTDTFTYTITDPAGQTATATETITITPPAIAAVNDSYSTPFNTALTTGNAATGDTFAAGSTFAKTTNPAHGTVVMNANGTYTYTPTSGYTGTDTFTYTITDPAGQTATATETITIGAPSAIAAVNDSYTTAFNTTLTTGNAAAGDTYAAGSTFAATSAPAHGTVAMNADGTYFYVPTAGYAGTDTFTYKITDPSGQVVTATETITITPPAIAAVNDSYSTPFNTALTTGNAASGDTYVAGSTFVATSTPAHGTVAMNTDGTYTYTPTAGYYGTDTFTYKVTDPYGQVATATDTITIVPPNNTLAAANDTISTLPNTVLNSALSSHVSDTFAGATYTFALGTTTPQHGSLIFNTDGTYQYTPALNYTGTDTFSYSVTDQFGKTAIATETILIQKPTLAAANDVRLLVANTTLNSTLVPHVSDTAAAPALTFTTVTAPSHGTVTLNADGTFSYVPTTNFTGTDVFTYQVTDQFGNIVTATETIVIQPPSLTAVNDVYSLAANTNLLGNAATNDTYAPGSQFMALSNPAHGTVVMNTDGTYTYTPNTNYVGSDSFAYMITDPTGAQRIASETITLTAPALSAVNDSYTTPYNTALSGAAGSNDTYTAGSTFTATSTPAHGTVTMNADGTYTYTPSSSFAGTDSFTYKITDPTGQVVTATENITITAPAITAVNDAYSTPYNTALNGNAATGDTYAAGSTFTATSTPSHGSVTMNADGTYTYTPATNYTGTDSFTYKITDPTGQVVTATENLTITAPAIAAVNDAYTTPYNTAVSGNAASGDTFAPGSTFTKATDPAHGTVTMKADGTYSYTPSSNFAGVDTFTYKITDPTGQVVTATETITVTAPTLSAVNDSLTTAYKTAVSGNAAAGDSFAPGSIFTSTSTPAHGTLTFNADGTYTYTPAANFAGTDTFTYKITDPTGQTVTATETITITPPALTTIDHTVNAAFNTPLNGNAATGDTFTPGSTFAKGTNPAHGTVTVNADGTYTYTPTAGFVGTDTFTYKVTDPTGAVSIATETIKVSVPAIAALPHTLTTPFNTALTSGNASLGDTYFAGSTFAATSAPMHGSVTMNANGTYTYTPSANFAGTDTFTYKVTDPSGQVATATETIKVLPPPPPTAINDKSTLKENTSTSGTLAGDVIEPVAGLPITFTVSSTTAHGTLTINPNGTFNYVPNKGFAGTDSFVYKVSDGLGGTATATMFITVTPDMATPQFKCLTTFENYASLNLFPV